MSRGPASVFIVLLVLAGGLLAGERPHIVFVLADDLGPGDLGCYGGAIAPTPSLDRLAREGTRFSRYYSASPICSPSRAGLITGSFPARWRITSFLQTREGNRGCGQDDFLDPRAPSLPRALKEAGYATAHFGKWHLGGGRDVKDAPKLAAYGFDENAATYESPEPHPAITARDWIWSPEDEVKRWERSGFFVKKALDFLARRKDRPCLVHLWLDDPHTPWIPGPGLRGDGPEALRGVLAEVDRQVGLLLDGLRDLGLEKSTLVLFASDNGPLPTFGGSRSAGLRGSKLSLHEGGIRVPFIARWPGRVPAGRVDEESVISAVDLFPTLCQLAGAKLPEGAVLDGEDRSGALLGAPSARSRPLFWEYGRNDRWFAYPRDPKDRSPNLAVRDGRWKLLLDTAGGAAELYDMAADPGESIDLSSREKEVAAALREKALAWRKGMP